jgi:hypothetical protein
MACIFNNDIRVVVPDGQNSIGSTMPFIESLNFTTFAV